MASYCALVCLFGLILPYGHVLCSPFTSSLTSLLDRADHNASQVEERYPGFVRNVITGVDLAEIRSPRAGLFQLYSVKNKIRPHMLPTSNLNYFVSISMVLLEKVSYTPVRMEKYDVRGGKRWGQWEMLENQMEVDDDTIERAFGADDIVLNDADAQALLHDAGMVGPWTSYELCRTSSKGPLVYAFGRRKLPEMARQWGVVDVGKRTTEFSTTPGDDFCEPPKSRPQSSEKDASSTLDVTSMVSDPATT